MTTRKNLRRLIAALSALAALGIAVAETPCAEAQTQTFTVLHSFCTQSNCPDGIEPSAPLVQASDGNFYGVTLSGDAVGGIVFRLTSNGTRTTLYTFCAQWGCPDGEYPAGLTQAADGNLYGVTQRGGSGAYCTNNPGGCGTLFRITPAGALTTLYNFCSQIGCPDGGIPLSSLVQAGDGNFYGATDVGGSGAHCTQNEGCGTIFRVTPSGTLTTLYNLCSEVGCTDGFGVSPLTEALEGNLYGTISNGGTGTYCPQTGTCGTIFRITPSGTFSTLHNFCTLSGCPDGQNPAGALARGADGNLYGATIAGGSGSYCILGSSEGCGILFKITPDGTLTSLYSLCSQPGCADGTFPIGGMIQGKDGNFYGTMTSGGKPVPQSSGQFSGGTVFRITPSGALSTLYAFCSQAYCRDGWRPEAGVIQATDGSLYGTTYAGGSTAEVCTTAPGCTADGWGTVFRVMLVPLASPSAGSLGFGDLFVGATSPSQSLTITNSGTADLDITEIALTGADGGDFAFTSPPLPISLAPGSATTIDVTFAPTTTGRLAADLVITDNSGGVPDSQQTIALSGTGKGLIVGIEIKPGDPTSTINLSSKGVVPVAILGSATFDPRTVNPTTVTFAGAHVTTLGNGTSMASFDDVNGDGLLDLVLHFQTQDLQLSKTDTQAVLKGQTFAGQLIKGVGPVRIVH